MKYPILESFKLKYEPENVLRSTTATGFFQIIKKTSTKKYIFVLKSKNLEL